MAGRSGAAAIEVELREAARKFDAHKVAQRIRAGSTPDEVLAAALDAIGSVSPRAHRREGEMFLAFGDESACGTRRVEVTSLCDAHGYGVEVHLRDDHVVAVSIYLE